MPKERRDRSTSNSTSTLSPYRCSTRQTKQSIINNPLEIEKSLEEWEDTRCPVCMEHPHNAILLLCSSHNNGCRPYMCDTSYRHSNCFDQFRRNLSECQQSGQSSEQSQPSKMACPLCRGVVNGWVVVDRARLFMNMKTRSCATETCDFSGTYTELRKHARLVHPSVRPSEVDTTRQQEWRRMERRRNLGDLLSTLRSSVGEERNEDRTDDLSFDGGSWFTVLFLVSVFQPGGNSWPGSSRTREQVTDRRWLRTGLWGEWHDAEAADGEVDGGAGSEPGPHSLFQFSRGGEARDNDDES